MTEPRTPRDRSYTPPPPPPPHNPSPTVPQRLAAKANNNAFVKRYRTEIAASASSCLSTLVAFPLDSVKTRMQAYKFSSFRDCLTQTYQQEGMKGFWRGSLAPLASITLVRTVSFSIYTKSNETYGSALRSVFGNSAVTRPNTASGTLPKPGNMICWALSGATAGAAITAIACPFEFTKLSAQIQYLMARSRAASMDEPANLVKYEPKGTAEAARYIVKTRGLRGLYSGFHLHFARDTLGTAIYFTIYESAKQFLSTQKEGAGSLAIASAGALCGLMSWVLIYPVDSAKSIYQRDVLTHRPGSPLPKRRFTFFNRRMYRGLGVSMSRSAMLNAVFFTSYEHISKYVDTS